jgi:hypothetical protein
MTYLQKLINEIAAGQHAEVYGEGLGETAQEVARDMLFYCDQEQMDLMAQDVGCDTDWLVQQLQEIAA